MYPAMLLVRPDLARDMLSYRIHGMDPAFERAASGGYNGKMFYYELIVFSTGHKYALICTYIYQFTYM